MEHHAEALARRDGRDLQARKSGDLWKEPGKAFITQRLTDAAEMLAALYSAAWDAPARSDDDVKTFVKYDGFGAGKPDAK
jgi:hypothetical protein